MWKLIVGFVLFALLAIFVLSRGGDIDMGGEKHEVAPSASHEAASAAAPVAASEAASLPAAAASAASN